MVPPLFNFIGKMVSNLVPPTLHPDPRPEIDVTQQERSEAMQQTKDKFTDIQEVYANCDEFPVNLASFSDTINVKGRLHLPESIKFFETHKKKQPFS